jgi:hypothetical protein
VLGDTAVQAELDALSAMYRTQVSANQEINESKLRRSEAANARFKEVGHNLFNTGCNVIWSWNCI